MRAIYVCQLAKNEQEEIHRILTNSVLHQCGGNKDEAEKYFNMTFNEVVERGMSSKITDLDNLVVLFEEEYLHTELDCLEFMKGKVVDINEINILDEILHPLVYEDLNKFQAVVSAEKPDTFKTIINLSLNLNNYTVVTDVMDLETIGANYDYSLHYKDYDGKEMRELDKDEYISIAKKLLSFKGKETPYGMVYKNKQSMIEYYNGDSLSFRADKDYLSYEQENEDGMEL